MKVKYIGTESPFFAGAITGSQEAWRPGQMMDVPDDEAAALIAAGMFEAVAPEPLESREVAAVPAAPETKSEPAAPAEE